MELYSLFEKTTNVKSRDNAINIIKSLNIYDPKTLKALVSIYNDKKVSYKTKSELLYLKYYDLTEMIDVYNKGFAGVIPISFYENEEFIKGANIKELPESFLEGCQGVKSFYLCSEIETIKKKAFKNCSDLEEVVSDITSSLKCIEDEVFYGCTNLKVLSIPDKNIKKGNNIYTLCSNLIL